ncbi:mast cell protease 2-like [Epinephelus fuscoguttatus]|uniref:mast cell protease 2-like n=1 Tax=Epinephelus fuscoguttatus TaxID=293821 RepID=UPI0020D0B1D8|nr:mast cell protease 2-like [Epinephelus fuscoguttatus]
MFFRCELVILIVGLTLDGQVRTGEIVGGHEAVAHSRPYMVLLDQHEENGKKKNCGGFLLSEDFVMTAAHCKARSSYVLLGLHNYHNKIGVQRVMVKETFLHEDYNEATYENDIMLLELSTKAILNENVKTIALADQGDGSLPKSCTVSGWGRTNRTIKSPSLILMEVNVTLTDSDQCNQEKTYCSKGHNGPAEGDSGGPLVCEDEKAYGVVSSRKLDSDGLEIYSYAKIPYYKSWIESKMKPQRKPYI